MIRLLTVFTLRLLCLAALSAEEVRKPAAVSSLEISELADFEKQPEAVCKLIEAALALTKLNLTYVFGSNDPKSGGMDCSGAIYHLLIAQGLKDTPRQSDDMGLWLQKKGRLIMIDQADSLNDVVFTALNPGDLIFWSITYKTKPRKLPITHVMLYLGKHKITKKAVIFGASDGRSYEGQKRTGVSVFNLTFPKAAGTAKLYGYGPIPGLIPLKSTSAQADPLPTKPQIRPKESKAE